MSHTESWIVAPRDGFFAKDGRGWYTSASGRARSLPWPFPTTIRGAIRGAWGRQLEATRGAPLDSNGWVRETAGVELGASLPVLGPPGEWTTEHRMWPVPADAFYTRAGGDGRAPGVERLTPRPPQGEARVIRFGTDVPAGLWAPAVPREKPASRPAWWTEDEFTGWCRGEPVAAIDADHRATREPCRRTEIRLKFDPRTSTAADGFLFSTELSEAIATSGRAWGVAAEVRRPEVDGVSFDGAMTYLGGKRRLALLEAADGLLDAPPDPIGDAPGIKVYVITPAHFERGWLPDGFTLTDRGAIGPLPPLSGDFILRSALVGRPLAVGGWDMHRRRPKPIRRLVPAGAVYFFERVDGTPITAADRAKLWLRAMPQHPTGQHDPMPGWAPAADGLGRVVAAPWFFDRTAPEGAS